ncbi:hypothetical protein FNH22_11190 [Fulvivirga sp. M361]|nr:hypothetical protein FNH22_11190 [Fulvivirga sp. M361]
MANGTFGAIPVSGTVKSVRLYYRINDASNGALDFIDLDLYYYDSLSQVPASLIAETTGKNGALLRRRNPIQQKNRQMARYKPRPPALVIVNRATR